MEDRFKRLAALAATQHSVVSTAQLCAHGVDSSMRSKWERRGLIERLGQRSFALGGSAPTFERAIAAGVADLAGFGVVAGRTAARLYGLDGFVESSLEFLLPRAHRRYSTEGLACSTRRPLTNADVITVGGFRCLTAERLILESAQFSFTGAEVDNAIDSSIRLRLVAEQRLRARAIRDYRPHVNGSRLVLDSLVDAGGESRLERWFLRLLREASIPRPVLQKSFRDGTRTVARVDAFFPCGLVVEVSGHGTHASRRQRQIDAQRCTELTLRGLRVITFTYEDVRDRPAWVIGQVRGALAMSR
jgi:hypothetical protein